MTIYQPYTYLIGWTEHNKWYYGVRYAKNCNPSDLWKTYFTSSTYVHNFREKYGEPDIIQVRKTFYDDKSARLWELRVLKKMDVLNREDFLNEAISLAMSPKSASNAGKISAQLRTNDQKLQFGRSAAIARVKNTTHEQRSEWGKKGMISRWSAMNIEERSEYAKEMAEKIPLEICFKCGMTLKKNQITRFHNEKCKADNTIKKYPQYSDEWNEEKFKVCEHCKMEKLSPSNYKRWHGDNCKKSPTYDINSRKINIENYKTCQYCNKHVAPNIFSQFHNEKCKHRN